MHHCTRPPAGRRESGAALIIAIFVLALAMVMITTLSTRFVVAARRTDNQLLADQAWYYLTGAEELATELLLLQLRDRGDEQADSLYRPDLFGQYETDDGWLSFSVLDLQGRFNINSLLSAIGATATEAGAANTAPLPRNLAQRRFIRLLLVLEEPQLAEAEAVAITEALLDWLDSNVMETGFGGAEQAFYARQPLPYRPADAPMRDISEMLLVKGVTPALYQALREHITVWPPEASPINVASADRLVIQALYDDEANSSPMAVESADAIVQAIRKEELTTMSEFLSRPEWGAVALKQEDLVPSSELFVIQSQTQVGRIRQAMDSVIRIKNDKAEVLARSLRML
jgi:general secretion pathway protein K